MASQRHVFLWARPASTIGPVFAVPSSLQSSLWRESASHEETEIPPRRFPRRRDAACPGTAGAGAEERGQDAEDHSQRQSRLARPDLDHGAADQGLRFPDLRSVAGGRFQLRAAPPDGRRLDLRGRRPNVCARPARRLEIPRRRAGALGRLHRLDPALGRARRVRPAHDALRRRFRADRRPQVPHQAQEAVPAAAGGAGQEQLLAVLRHARAHGKGGPDEAGDRDDRLGPLPLPEGRVRVRRQGVLGEVRRLYSAQGAGRQHRRRPHSRGRSHRMGVHQRPVDRDGGAARRGRDCPHRRGSLARRSRLPAGLRRLRQGHGYQQVYPQRRPCL